MADRRVGLKVWEAAVYVNIAAEEHLRSGGSSFVSIAGRKVNGRWRQ
jgi:hypothetical protein